MLSPDTLSLSLEEQFTLRSRRLAWEDLTRREMIDELMFCMEQLMIRDNALVRNMKGNF